MKKLLLPILIGLSFSALSSDSPNRSKDKQTLANEVDGSNKYFDESERGWFWYETLTQEEKDELHKKIAAHPAKNETEKKEEVKPLSNKWFRENFEKYSDAAINNPYDKEAMRTYLYLEKFMRDRANAFGLERQKAVLAEPFLDSTSTRPIANFGMKTMNVQATDNKNSLLQELSKSAGLYYFFRGNDPFSVQQAELISMLSKQYGFTVLPISTDGTPPPKVLGEQFEVDTGQAHALGIQVIPATYLFNSQKNTFELVGQGMHSLTDLKDRIIHASLRGGIIDEQQYQLTRPTGLYTNPNGYVSGSLDVPVDAPKEFIDLYNRSQQ